MKVKADHSVPKISGQALRVLLYLRDGSRSRKLNEIARHLGTHRAYVSHLLRSLHKKGLVARDWYKADLTEEGMKLID